MDVWGDKGVKGADIFKMFLIDISSVNFLLWLSLAVYFVRTKDFRQKMKVSGPFLLSLGISMSLTISQSPAVFNSFEHFELRRQLKQLLLLCYKICPFDFLHHNFMISSS